MKDITSLLIRRATIADIDSLLELSKKTGDGMTTMPIDSDSWESKLARSEADFNRKEAAQNGDIYFLVLENVDNNQIVGCCAVYAGVGLTKPFYSYKLSVLTNSSEKLDLTIHTRVLHLVNDYMGGTELGSLFLLPEYRRDGIGKFLSRSRLLLLADFPERFGSQVFAELRGWLDENDQSPFWEHLAHKFFGLSYQKADFISAVDGSQFISDLMPKYPVYLDLLPKEAQDVVGKPNDDAIAAYEILNKEGFQYTGYVDIFDAGPCVQTQLSQIKTIRNSEEFEVNKILNENDALFKQAQRFIISNKKLQNYCMVYCKAVIENNKIILSDKTAKLLQIKTASKVRAVKA